MKTIVLLGWNVGFRKVTHTEFLRARLGWSLAQAKLATDAVLANEVVRLEVPEDEYAELVDRLIALGARVENCG